MITELARQDWDVIVVGTGMGGGTIGRKLAEMGLKVLFLEQGPAGYRAEETPLNAEMFDPIARAVRGFWPSPVRASIDGRNLSFFAPLGAGLGGSSVFYAATLERPERHDLEDSPDRPHPVGGWPVGYDAMRPYFDAAERLYRVSGEPDPLSDTATPGLSSAWDIQDGDRAIMARLRKNGLHPYRLHSAIRHVDGCKECLGFKCPRHCKMDARSAGVEPALATGNATLQDNCLVKAVRGDKNRVTHVEVRLGGATHDLRARRYVLSGGALGSASLLLASASETWPDGFANANRLIGRNLMFHMNEMIAVWPQRHARFDGPSKAISFRDLYYRDGQRFGMVQAMGIDASYGEIAYYLKSMVDRSALRNVPLLRDLTRVPAAIAARVFGNAKVFVGLIEDLPYADNRVLPGKGPTDIRFQYEFAPELLQRRRAFRREIRKAFRGHRRMFLGFQPELNFGHPCGTLRFGTDPRSSVLDADCRVHGMENLYVVDASFMPTSTGVNPSLTIAANALRVAERLAQGLTKGAEVGV